MTTRLRPPSFWRTRPTVGVCWAVCHEVVTCCSSGRACRRRARPVAYTVTRSGTCPGPSFDAGCGYRHYDDDYECRSGPPPRDAPLLLLASLDATMTVMTSSRITYDTLWVHAKRHYDLAGIAVYWRVRMYKELRNALGG